MKALVVDDSEIMANAIAALLRPFQVKTVGTFEEAETAVRQESYALIALDLDLPDSPAALTLGWIPRLKYARGAAKVVVISASAMPEEIQRAKENGADALVAKTDAGFMSRVRALALH